MGRPGGARSAHHLPVQRLAHAVQALKLVLAWHVVAVHVLRHAHDGRQRVRIVRGKLGVHHIGRDQQFLGAGQVRHVGVVLAGVDRVVALPVELGAFDFAVPIRAFDQTHHQPVACAARQVHHKVDHQRAALLVGLNDKADAVPALQAGGQAQRFEQVQRDVQAVHLFGVDVQADVVVPGQLGELQHPWQQFIHHALVLGAAVARVQGRELDRDAGAVHHALALGCLANRVDRVFIGLHVTLRVGFGQGRFAQHVIRVAKALRFHCAGAVQGLVNRLAGHKLLAQHLHGKLHTLADQRLAAFADQAGERGQHRTLVVCGHQLAREQQTPGRGVHKQRRAAAHMLVPVALANLVADQRVARGRIGDAQQRLGQAHQRHALFAGQRVGLHQALHATCAPAQLWAFAHALHQLAGQRVGAFGLFRVHAGGGQQGGQGLRFRQAGGAGDGFAQGAALRHGAAGGEVGARGQGVWGHGCVHGGGLADSIGVVQRSCRRQ